ncbi:MAG: tRNA dihydrouridine synthase [Candidatus Saccharimonadia bacterium]
MNFWQDLSSPIFILAPMDDVTNSAFRRTVAKAASPDVFFTEFANVDGLCSPGAAKIASKIEFSPIELQKPLVAQLWGHDPDNFYSVTERLIQLGFSGIDLNMGCPVKNVVAHGCCSALIRDRDRASQIIIATKAAAKKVPVSVKTRIGIDSIITEDWVEYLLGFDLAAITIHTRTVKEQSKVPAHWDELSKIVTLRNQMKKPTKIIGNGDISSRAKGVEISRDLKVDGVMIGRGIFSNIFAFEKVAKPHSEVELINLFLFHLSVFEQSISFPKNFAAIKKFAKVYIRNGENSSAIRDAIMQASTISEIRSVLQNQQERMEATDQRLILANESLY